MNQRALARRYAGALFRAAREMDLIDKVESDLGLITYSVQSMPSLRDVLAHPLIPPARKKEIVAQIFRAGIEPLTLDFLSLLIDRRREGILEQVEEEYVRIADDFLGIIPAVVTSAVPLTKEEQKLLREKLEAYTGKNVELQLAEDPDLIGGLSIRIQDTVIDGSVRGYLASLRVKLLGRE